MKNVLYCGAARADITPDESWLPWITGLMPEPFGGVLHPVHVRVMVLKNQDKTILIAGYELLILFTVEALTHRLKALFNLPEENIMIFCTHTHMAPHEKPTDAKNIRGEYSGKYLEFLENQTVKAAREAFEVLRPVRMGNGFSVSEASCTHL